MGRRVPILGLVFAVLLVLTLVLLQEEAPEPQEAFFALKRRTPDTLMFVHPRETITLVPGGRTGWKVIAPYSDRADAYIVEGILSRVAELTPIKSFPFEDGQADVLGLRVPRVMFRAAYTGADPDTLLVGGLNPGSTMSYVRSGAASEVGLIPAGDAVVVINTRSELRDRNAFPIVASSLVELRLEARGRLHALYRKDDEGRWEVAAPFPGPVDAGSMADYLKLLANINIEQFLPEEPPPVAELRAWAVQGSGDSLWVALGREGSHRRIRAWAVGRPGVFEVSEAYRTILQRPTTRLRFMKLSRLGSSDADSLTGPDIAWAADSWMGEKTRGSKVRGGVENWFTLEAEQIVEATADAQRRWEIGAGTTYIWWSSGDTLSAATVGAEIDGLRAVYLGGGLEARAHELLLFDAPRLNSILAAFHSKENP